MKRSLSLGALVLLLASPLGADEAPAPSPPAAPTQAKPPPALSPSQAADDVLAAIAAGDVAALDARARVEDPSPWMVVDELLRRGEHAAAQRLAGTATRVDTEALPAYVAAQRGKPDDPARRERLAKVLAALEAGKPQEALDALAAPEPAPPEDVVGVRLALRRGMALRGLGRLEEAAGAYLSVGLAAERLGWLTAALLAYGGAGGAADDGSDYPRALDAWQRGLALCERRGDRPNAARALGNLANIYKAQGDYTSATATYQRVLAEFEALGARDDAAATLTNLGDAYQGLARYAEAATTFERAVEAHRALGDRAGEGRAQGGLGSAYLELGDQVRARACFESARATAEELGAVGDAAMQLLNLGAVHGAQGDYPRALALEERALEVFGRVGDRSAAARALANIAAVRFALGDYSTALTTMERVLQMQRQLGSKREVARALGDLASVLHAVGEHRQALALQEQALEGKEASGDRVGVISTLSNIGIVLRSLGEVDQALAVQQRALAAATEMGDKAQIAVVWGAIASCHSDRGDWAAALQGFRQALEAHEALGNKGRAARALASVGNVLAQQGQLEAGRAELERAVRTARSLRLTPVLVDALSDLAGVHLLLGAPGRALSAAQQALRESEALLGGLGEEEGASARARHARLYRVGALAAAREGDLGETLAFLESGRAGALLDALDKRETLRWKSEELPEDLKSADAQATAQERRARRAYEEASRGVDRKATAAAGRALDEAMEAVRAVNGRIQRQNKRAAGLFYPRARALEEVQGALEGGEALVLYGLGLDAALALVVEREGARLVMLGPHAGLEPALERLRLSKPEGDPTEALATMRALLVEPLGLGAEVTTVLVSPEGPLCFLPWGALVDRPVVVTPSGTTHAILREDVASGGEGVLALGDPDYAGVSKGAQAIYYRGRSLAALPATRAEAQAVGTTVLVGAAASEDGFRAELGTKKRWKAVHFACHGLIDPTRPTLSSLSLSRAGEEDGFLTALEVMRMQIPADLAVLSACETGTGKLVGGEGIVGLTRAFMYAGTPRVLCSLWKVDDEATAALMTKFYELWNPQDGKPGLPTAEAMRQAQEFVRRQERWKHPYFWAAWVLWGLPD